MSGVAPRPLSEFSALSNEELAKLLPDYAHPNWQGDGFKLVKYRLWNGGFDRLEKYGDIPRYSPNLRTDQARSKKLNWHIMLDNTLKDQKDVIISVRAELLSRQLEEPKSRIIMV
jgi:hypothetical protein